MADSQVSHYRTHDLQEYGLSLATRELFLVGEDYSKVFDDQEPGVEYLMASRFIKNLRLLDSTDGSILVHMKTCGGDWTEGMAIFQAIKTCRSHVTILNWTHARSMSSLILQAADHRVMMPYSYFMYHDGTFSTDGTVKQAHTEYEQLKLCDKQMMEIYLDSAEGAPAWEGRTRNQIKKIMRGRMDRREEVYLTPHDTVAQGFADEVLDDYDITRIRAGR